MRNRHFWPCQWTTPMKQPTPCPSPGTHTARTQIAQARESETEPQSSGGGQSSSEHSSNAQALIMSPSDDDTEVPGTLLHTVFRGKGPKHCQQDETSTGMPTTPNHYIARRFFTIGTAPTNADYAHRLKRPSPDTSTHK